MKQHAILFPITLVVSIIVFSGSGAHGQVAGKVGVFGIDIDGISEPVDDESWHLMTRSQGGAVSLVKHLSQHECQFMLHRVLHEPATPEEVKAAQDNEDATMKAGSNACAKDKGIPLSNEGQFFCMDGKLNSWDGGSYSVSAGDIVTAECFQ